MAFTPWSGPLLYCNRVDLLKNLSYVLVYLLLAALGLHFMWAFSSCSAWASCWSGSSCCRARPLENPGLSSCGARLSGSSSMCDLRSWTRDWTPVPCPLHWRVGSQPLYHEGSLPRQSLWQAECWRCDGTSLLRLGYKRLQLWSWALSTCPSLCLSSAALEEASHHDVRSLRHPRKRSLWWGIEVSS